MKDRIKKLRQDSLDAINHITSERAELVTDFYLSLKQEYSKPVTRALCFSYILEKKHICINDSELIVGERGPAPKATPTYPEINLHTEEDLQILNDRKKVSFFSDESTRRKYSEKIIPQTGES